MTGRPGVGAHETAAAYMCSASQIRAATLRTLFVATECTTVPGTLDVSQRLRAQASRSANAHRPHATPTCKPFAQTPYIGANSFALAACMGSARLHCASWLAASHHASSGAERSHACVGLLEHVLTLTKQPDLVDDSSASSKSRGVLTFGSSVARFSSTCFRLLVEDVPRTTRSTAI